MPFVLKKNRAKARFFYILRTALDNSAQAMYNCDKTLHTARVKKRGAESFFYRWLCKLPNGDIAWRGEVLTSK